MDQYVILLKQFVGACQANSDLLHDPKLAFYRDYLTSLGATIPEKKVAPKPEPTPSSEETPAPPKPQQEEVPKPAEIPYPQIDNEGVIEPETNGPLPMGDAAKEPSDDDFEKASSERDLAMEAFSNGDFDGSLTHYTNAIEANPGSAILYAKRANVLLKLKRPIGAIADCDRAISINPDSAQAYKFRGRANRLLGKWVEAKTDLATACKLDYDDTANEWLKEVEPNAHKIQEYNRAVERRNQEIEIGERRERVRKAQEANRKAAEEAAKAQPNFGEDFDFGNFNVPGGAGGAVPEAASKLFSDPEVSAAMQDPEVMPALLDIMSNPGNVMKHLGNPKIAKLMAKLQQSGGFPGMFGQPGAPAGGCPQSGCADPGCGPNTSSSAPKPPPPSKAPEPDLD